MGDVLDQSEIDALLASVAEEAAGTPETPTTVAVKPPPGLDATAGFARHDVSTYDFKRPERVSKDHIRALGSIHDGFARNFGATLSGFLRTIIDVRVVGVEQLTYSEFIHSLPNPTCFVIVQAPPLEGQMCVEISPLIVYPIIDRLLGGSSSDMFIPQRPLTAIEWRLMRRLINKALEHLSEVWRNLVEAKFDVVDTESNPQLVHIVAPTEVVVFITFEIKMGQCAGTMSICIPFNTIESVLSKLTTQSWFGYARKGATQTQRQRIVRNLTHGKVGLTAFLGRAQVRLSELRALRPGDIIQLEKHVKKELLLQIEGRNKFAGVAGQYRGRRALRITRRAEIDEAI
ncbi:MAG TPA: flagellar motor switch protein FliM [Phycisphaerae bacterium]|nr:flagellar motor switch protein FliM [Phycisphaerae bacterium]HPM24291.1 flagellar motor switch protein FliM [Phycisphaerae bacterium]